MDVLPQFWVSRIERGMPEHAVCRARSPCLVACTAHLLHHKAHIHARAVVTAEAWSMSLRAKRLHPFRKVVVRNVRTASIRAECAAESAAESADESATESADE